LSLTLVLAASAAFVGGWCCHSWACSKRTDCPKYEREQLEKWKQAEEQKLHARHPTPPGGKAA
jgi:hypothetical protein